jgi:hypothetical protein
MSPGATILLAIVVLVACPLAVRTIPGWTGPGGRPIWLARRLSLVGAPLLAVALVGTPGPAAAILALPWAAAALLATLAATRRLLADPDRFRPGPRHAEDAALGFWLVGSVFAVADRAGVTPFGFDPTLVRLTVIHFHVAGLVLPTAGSAAWRTRPSRWLELGLVALIAGIPLTAVGFFGLGVANWTGAMLVVAGAVAVAAGQLRVALTASDAGPVARPLLAVAGGSLLLAMPFAAVYATADLLGMAGPSVAWMIASHGTLNALGFAVPSMVGWWRIRARQARRLQPRGTTASDAMRRAGRAAGFVAIGYAVVLGLWLRDNAEPQASSPLPGWIALAALFATPGVLALVAVARRSGWLLGVAGAMCLVQSFVSFAGVTLPFLAPAAVMLHAAGRSGQRRRSAELPAAAAAALAWLMAWALRLELLGTDRDGTRSGAVLIGLLGIVVAGPLLILPGSTSKAPR